MYVIISKSNSQLVGWLIVLLCAKSGRCNFKFVILSVTVELIYCVVLCGCAAQNGQISPDERSPADIVHSAREQYRPSRTSIDIDRFPHQPHATPDPFVTSTRWNPRYRTHCQIIGLLHSVSVLLKTDAKKREQGWD